MTAGPATSLLFAGATIRRWPDTEPTNGPFVITDGRVAGLDDASTEASAGSVDVAGLHILLGFVDPHSHLSVAVWVLWFADGLEWESAARALTGVRRAASVHASGWFIAFNIDEDEWPDGAPTTADLEPVACRPARGAPGKVPVRSLRRLRGEVLPDDHRSPTLRPRYTLGICCR